jgi:hypothetical protein
MDKAQPSGGWDLRSTRSGDKNYVDMVWIRKQLTIGSK